MITWKECRNCKVLKEVGHRSKEQEHECIQAIGRKYGWFDPGIPLRSLWVLKEEQK